MRIRSKLLVNTLITLICLGIVGGIGVYYTHHVARMSLSLVTIEAEPILKINQLEALAWENWLRLIVHSGISEVETMQQLEQEMAQFDQQIAQHIQALEGIYVLNKVEAAEHVNVLQAFQKNWQLFHNMAEQVLLLSQDFTKEDALRLIIKQGRVAFDKAIANLRELVKQHRKNMETLRDAALQARQQALWTIVTLTLLIGVSVLFFTHRFIGRLLAPLFLLNQHLKALAQGQLVAEDIKCRGKDEIAEIVQSAKQLRDSMTSTIEQANAVAAGNYHYEVQLRSEQDKLGLALSEMTHTLREVTAKNAVQDWFKTGQTQLHDQVSGELMLVDLAHNVVSFLTLYLEGQIGICYLVEQTAEDLNQHLCLKQIASYAYTRRKNLNDEFEFSTGLIERAAKGQESVLLTIDAGLGEEMPRHLLMIPFLYENVVKGVMVLGFSKPITEVQQEFLNQVMPSIGIAVNSVDSRTKLQALLTKTQIQAEELQSQKDILQHQTEELQHQKEELQSQSEELQSQTEELQTQQEELRQTNDELEERTRELERQREDIRKKNQALEKSQQAIQTKAEELELASKYKSEFLANMSHELRTPLNSMLILAQLLADNKTGNLNDKQIEYARTVHSAGADLLTLINEILDLSKVEAGKMEIHVEPVRLSDLVETLGQKFRPLADNKGLAFHLTIADDLPAQLSTDVQRLHQIINNLLSNAFKFTSQGEIKLTMQHPQNQEDIAHLGLDAATTLAISVTDTGIGIPKDKQKVIFEAFQQVDGTTSRRFGGTGLGLSISRQLARLLGGDIRLSAEEGKGSTFTLYLPEKLEKPAGVQKPSSADVQAGSESQKPEPSVLSQTRETTTSGNNNQNPLFKKAGLVETTETIADDRDSLKPEDKSLLIVEDDRKFSRLLMDIAREKGFKCLMGEDGKTGLQLAQQYQPHAIILDVGLPQMDGWTVMEKLKDNPDTRHIPVHFMSAFDQGKAAKKMGAIGYLLKPVNMEQLGQAFQKIEQFVTKDVKNVLVVVDDEARQREIFSLVGNEEVQTTPAVTIAAALEHLKVTPVDCIVLDLDVEQGTGIQLLEQIQKQERLRPTPLIIYAERELTPLEEGILLQCEDNLTIKAVRSPERLLDEATLFLHQFEANLSADKRKMIRMVHDKTTILMNKKVLIVDDDMRNVYALATVLEDYDMEIICSANGKEGLAKLETHNDIDIVLMDIMMPEMDGYEAMQHIRKQPHNRQLPIIALTAKAMKGDKAKCIEAGANDYITKPVDTDKLISLMRVWLYR